MYMYEDKVIEINVDVMCCVGSAQIQKYIKRCNIPIWIVKSNVNVSS